MPLLLRHMLDAIAADADADAGAHAAVAADAMPPCCCAPLRRHAFRCFGVTLLRRHYAADAYAAYVVVTMIFAAFFASYVISCFSRHYAMPALFYYAAAAITSAIT